MQRARSDEAKDERRAILLNAALDEFFEKGFAAARMDDIARRAGLSKGAVYIYFDSKETLFKALIEQLAAPNIERIEQIASGSVSIEQALDRLAAFAPLMIRQTDLPRLMKVLVGDSHTFPEIIQAYRREVLERLLSILADALKQAEARGEIELRDAALTARLLLAPIAFSGLWHAVFGKVAEAAVDLDTLFRLHADNMLKALRPEGRA